MGNKKDDTTSLCDKVSLLVCQDGLSQIVTMEDWIKENMLTDFAVLTDQEEIDRLSEMYKLQPLTLEDLYFTDNIEDDRINTTAVFSDYDWMTYTYDTRFPTQSIGTLAVRFEYIGATISTMYVRQYLPAYITKESQNIVICHEYDFQTNLFIKYMEKDFLARIKNEESTKYAYCADQLMLSWYNDVLSYGTKKPTQQDISEPYHWESVYMLPNR